MYVYIRYKHKEFATKHIPKVLRAYVERYYNLSYAIKIDRYLREYKVQLTTRDILLYAIDTLQAVSTEGGYMLKVDKNKTPPGSKYNIETLIKLVTFGTVDLRGYPILKDAFKFVENNTERIARVYIAKQEKKEKK